MRVLFSAEGNPKWVWTFGINIAPRFIEGLKTASELNNGFSGFSTQEKPCPPLVEAREDRGSV